MRRLNKKSKKPVLTIKIKNYQHQSKSKRKKFIKRFLLIKLN